ncbi:hypothetical protein B0H19DRAFT_1079632 [Mycena capillaripes]|nr:hypothetical protein B0H19DRAFT_1079632 [Mycena capillaripes]
MQLWTTETAARGQSNGLVIGIPVSCSCGQQKLQSAADLMGRASGCAEKCGTSTERTEKIINKRKSKETCWVVEGVIGEPLSAVLGSEESCLMAGCTRKAMPGDVRQNLL